MARIAEDRVTREWWTHTDAWQTPFNPGRDPDSTAWRDAAEIWHLDP